jgi:DNA invertase Pin-like site-specific DNA recombinase
MSGSPVFDKRRRKPLRAVLYVRISKGDKQDARSQLGALRPFVKARGWAEAAVERDNVSGDPARRKGDPPGLRAALRLLADREADVLVVFAADRLVRSPIGLLQLVGRVQALGAHVASAQDGGDLDTTSDVGELLTFLRGWYARMEMKLIRARTIAGLERARAQGKTLGRPRLDDGIDTRRLLKAREKGTSWATLATDLGVSAATIRRRHADALQAQKGST